MLALIIINFFLWLKIGLSFSSEYPQICGLFAFLFHSFRAQLKYLIGQLCKQLSRCDHWFLLFFYLYCHFRFQFQETEQFDNAMQCLMCTICMVLITILSIPKVNKSILQACHSFTLIVNRQMIVILMTKWKDEKKLKLNTNKQTKKTISVIGNLIINAWKHTFRFLKCCHTLVILLYLY